MYKIDLIAKALVEYRKIEGKRWRHKLYADWEEGAYSYSHRDYECYLQQCRNYFFDLIAHDIKDDATEEDILFAFRKEVLFRHLDVADAITVNDGPMLTSWDLNTEVLSVSWSTEEANVRMKIKRRKIEKIETPNDKTWVVTEPSGTYDITCFTLKAMSVA